ncbi:MAG: YeiH family putative sulfate export transporter [Cardiobacteriaceae bacterium]|nr:YeiH family putative sulfate export transporter [Cardiobacteriaceae bacterium]
MRTTKDEHVRSLHGFFIRVAWGVLLCGFLAALAIQGAPLFGTAVSPLLLAILLGLLLGNTIYPRLDHFCLDGTLFVKGRVLRTAIVLYGFRLTFHDVAAVGWAAFFADALMLISTFMLALWLGRHYFQLDRDTSILIGAGASICGAAAVLATEPVLKAEPYKVSVAVATVVVFGTLSMLLYPLMYSSHWFPFSGKDFGVYIGSTVHEVAQVVAAGAAVCVGAADSAVITKMVRVMMLAPFLLWLSYMLMAANGRGGRGGRITIPWFALGFIVMVGVHSLLPTSAAPWIAWIVALDNVLLAMAMAALGLTTYLGEIRRVGVAPFKVAACLFIWLMVGGAVINATLHGVMG